jgi:hypothetical protein
MTASLFLALKITIVQEKVYHPPPPGKGKDAKHEENGEASRAEPVEAIEEQSVAAS